MDDWTSVFIHNLYKGRINEHYGYSYPYWHHMDAMLVLLKRDLVISVDVRLWGYSLNLGLGCNTSTNKVSWRSWRPKLGAMPSALKLDSC